MMHKLLMRITAKRPCKTIEINEKPYLERYYMGGLFGYQVWLHRFLTADSERHLHNHPWVAFSFMLAGWYKEEARIDGLLYYRFRTPSIWPSRITPNHIHRIAAAEPDTWTLMVVGSARRANWWFYSDDGKSQVMPSSRDDWWKAYGVRK